MTPNSLTGIPVEYLFGAIAALVSIIYADLKRSVSKNTEAGNKRDLILVKICEKLNITYPFDK